ncbi:MAG: DUF4351 domain-containing protein [Dolichospermum sp. DET68]
MDRRFGSLSSDFSLKINQLSITQLEELAAELLDLTEINQLENWLQQNHQNLKSSDYITERIYENEFVEPAKFLPVRFRTVKKQVNKIIRY